MVFLTIRHLIAQACDKERFVTDLRHKIKHRVTVDPSPTDDVGLEAELAEEQSRHREAEERAQTEQQRRQEAERRATQLAREKQEAERNNQILRSEKEGKTL